MNIAVAGTGYVGLVTAAVLAHCGHTVTSVDVDRDKILALQSGICPIFEPGLNELIAGSKDRLSFSTDYQHAYSEAEVVIIAVGTPEKRDGSADLSYVYRVAAQIAENITQDCIVVVKSTVPIGTGDELDQYMKTHLGQNTVHIVSNPEFLSQGTAVNDTLHAARIVIGYDDPFAREAMERMYAPLGQTMLFTDRRSAEMIKYASNNFLALKISYINEIANLCEELNANIEDVANGMGMDARIGDKFLNAGIGYGGSCFPKDTKALHWLSCRHGIELKTIKAAIEINEYQKIRFLQKAHKYYKDLRGVTVAVLGLTFKPRTDDLREAPALSIIPKLIDDGAIVKAWDPRGVERFKKITGDSIAYLTSIEETLQNADLCMILTEWEEIKALKPEDFLRMRHPIVLDGRNCYPLEQMEAASILYDSIGRPVVRPQA